MLTKKRQIRVNANMQETSERTDTIVQSAEGGCPETMCVSDDRGEGREKLS